MAAAASLLFPTPSSIPQPANKPPLSLPPSTPNSDLLQPVQDLNSLRQIHAHILKSPPQLSIHTQNALIALYSLFNHMDSAILAFQRITPNASPTTFTYNMIIRGFSTHGPHLKTLEFYSHLLHSHTLPDKFTYPFVLKACAALSAVDVAREAHGRAIRSGLASDVYISTALVDLYLKLGAVDDALRVFDGMSVKNVVSWNALIAGFEYNGLDEEAVGAFGSMLDSGLEPNSSTVVAVLPAIARLGALGEGKFIHEWIVRRGLEMNELVRNSFIAMYGKCGELEQARKLFNDMPERTDASWNAIISAYMQEGNIMEALKLFYCMQISGFRPTAISIASVLPACGDLVDIRLGKKMHGYSFRNGFESSLVVSTALVDTYAKCGCVEAAKQVFSMMPERNIVSFNAMISGYGLHGHGKDALELFRGMQKEAIKPNERTFVSLINACSHAGMVTEGMKCFKSMHKHYGIVPQMKHYSCVVDLLGRAGQLKEAYEFIEQIPIEIDDVVWGALLGACRTHKNMELGEIAAKRAIELNPEEPGYYVTLANMYAVEGRWADSHKLREAMRERSLQKEVGCSWIEEGGTTHSFVAGDFRHLEWGKIHKKMLEIGRRLREEGYAPDTRFVLHETAEEVKDERLSMHSERIALAFGLLKIGNGMAIRISKNLRICGDCHAALKLVSRIYGREIIVRDSHRFHRFEGGLCSCKDYW
ncbi:hypothetical protein ACLOJK_005851 [Asimina triloba]